MYVAQRLRKAVDQARFQVANNQKDEQLTISIGVAMYPRDAENRRGLIEAADAALYAAKRRGRNQVLTYAQVMQADRKQKEVS